jgi:hypothetical protein
MAPFSRFVTFISDHRTRRLVHRPVAALVDRKVDFYRISVLGRLPEDHHDAFSPLLIKLIGSHTILLGPIADHNALQGILSRIHAFGLELDELKRVRSKRSPARRLRAVD